MSTVRVMIDQLRDGDIINEDLFSNNDNISLIVKGTAVDKRVRDKISNLELDRVLISREDDKDDEIVEHSEHSHSIKKDKFKESYREKVSDIKDIFKSVLDGNEIDLEKVSAVSDDVFKNVDDIYVAIESISELKDFDDYTYIHSVNVALYSMLLAQWIDLDKSDVKHLVKAGVLHDIGKAKVADEILNKPGALTDQEFLEMKNHPQYGYDICKDMDGLDSKILEPILSHHEKIDGSGYPNGLKGDEISLFSKIIAVCDVYDAITSKRVYKEKITPFDTFDEIMNYGYGKLDTDIMLTFLNNIGNLYLGLNVKLNTGEVGEIMFIPPNKLSQPLIKVGNKFVDLSVDSSYKIEEIV